MASTLIQFSYVLSQIKCRASSLAPVLCPQTNPRRLLVTSSGEWSQNAWTQTRWWLAVGTQRSV